jgi:hypothetical protein
MSRAAFMLFLPASVIMLAAEPVTQPTIDDDRDGLDDRTEQRLLVKFAPTFLISSNECDGLPAEFAPGVRDPQVVSRNGTIYGQVFMRQGRPGAGVYVEIHYYHLWSRDCGRAGHPLDAEHVSALVWAPAIDTDSDAWTALLWYSGAHEDTACDESSGARARDVQAENLGPKVWVSRGKHASFLERAHCSWGCGSDTCDAAIEFTPTKLINIGEVSALLNGAVWVQSTQWRLESKLAPVFDDSVISRLAEPKVKGVRSLKRRLKSGQSLLMARDSTVDSLGTGGRALTVSGVDTTRLLPDTYQASKHRFVQTASLLCLALDSGSKRIGRSLRNGALGLARSFGF